MPESGSVTTMVQEAFAACFRCGSGGGTATGDTHPTSKGDGRNLSGTEARNRSKAIDKQIKSDQRKQHRQVREKKIQ